MRKVQRVILGMGILVLGGIVLFPPWVVKYDPGVGDDVPDGLVKSERFMGHQFILSAEPEFSGAMFGLTPKKSDPSVLEALKEKDRTEYTKAINEDYLVRFVQPSNFSMRLDGSRMTVEVLGILGLSILLVWLVKPVIRNT
jgi:hypothetical protein